VLLHWDQFNSTGRRIGEFRHRESCSKRGAREPDPSAQSILRLEVRTARPFGDARFRVTGGTRRSLLLVNDLVVGLDHIVLGPCGLTALGLTRSISTAFSGTAAAGLTSTRSLVERGSSG
jgi:hypothetical protein